jgi:hypothetical protein
MVKVQDKAPLQDTNNPDTPPPAQQGFDNTRARLAQAPGAGWADAGGQRPRAARGGAQPQTTPAQVSLTQGSTPVQQFDASSERFSSGPRTGQKAGSFTISRLIATRGGPYRTSDTTSLKFGERSSQTFSSQEDAAAYARSLKNDGGAAVVADNGRYAVYKLEETGWFDPNFNLDSIQPRGYGASADVKGGDASVKALITGDGYVTDLSGGQPQVELSGSARDPFSAHLETFGPGLQKLTGNRERFERQFELAMRDTAFAALDHSQQAAQETQSRLDGNTFTPEDRAAMQLTQDRLAPVDERILAKRKELDAAKSEEQSLSLAIALSDGFYSPVTMEECQAAAAKTERVQSELNQLQAERTQAARDFPLLLRVDPAKMGEFKEKSEADQVAFMRGEAKQVIADIKTTRDRLKSGDFNLWTMDGIRNTTAAGLGLNGEQLKWVEERAKHEGRVEAAWKIGESVLTIGLAVGGAFFTGGWSLTLLGASSVLALHGAIDTTSDYYKTNAAANTDLDPNAGLIPQDLKGHWGWVAAAWIGVGLDTAAVVSAVRALKAGKALTDVAKSLNTDAKVLKTAMQGADAAQLEVKTMQAGEFTARYGKDIQAVTLVREGKDGRLSVEIVSNAALSRGEREAALAEEFAHLQQLGNPAMRAKMLKLSEERLAGWQQMQPDEKLALIRNKLEVEADAQRILIEHGGPNADKALARGNLAGIERKLDELDAAQRAGRTREAVEGAEAPRLFAKKIFTATPSSREATNIVARMNALPPAEREKLLARSLATDGKGRRYGTPGAPEFPTVGQFSPRVREVRAGDLAQTIKATKHGINPPQAKSIQQMSTEELLRFRLEDPISASRVEGGLSLTGGHHRINEIIRRVESGELPPDTIVQILIHE